MHSNLTEQINSLSDQMEFDKCDLCGSQEVVRLPADWQDGKTAIPIVGCGNPWHYATQSLGDSPEFRDEA